MKRTKLHYRRAYEFVAWAVLTGAILTVIVTNRLLRHLGDLFPYAAKDRQKAN